MENRIEKSLLEDGSTIISLKTQGSDQEEPCFSYLKHALGSMMQEYSKKLGPIKCTKSEQKPKQPEPSLSLSESLIQPVKIEHQDKNLEKISQLDCSIFWDARDDYEGSKIANSRFQGIVEFVEESKVLAKPFNFIPQQAKLHSQQIKVSKEEQVLIKELSPPPTNLRKRKVENTLELTQQRMERMKRLQSGFMNSSSVQSNEQPKSNAILYQFHNLRLTGVSDKTPNN